MVPFAHRRLSARFTHLTSVLPFSNTMPKRSRCASLRELADDRAVRRAARRRRRTRSAGRRRCRRSGRVVQRRDRVVVRVVHGRALRGPDEPRDVAVARRADLGAELVRPQAGDGPHARDRRSRVRDDRLVDEVVRVRERDVPRTLRRERDLRHVEVERLVAGPERVVERDCAPRHLALREAELPRHRVGDGRLVPLAARRVRDLPRLLRRAAPPRRERRVVGREAELALLDEIEVRLRAASGLRGLRRASRSPSPRGRERESSGRDARRACTHRRSTPRDGLTGPRASVPPRLG